MNKKQIIKNKVRRIVKEVLNENNKTFNTMLNVGKSKYVINYYDGIKTHKDGSPFKDIIIFSNKKDYEKYKTYLINNGYTEQ